MEKIIGSLLDVAEVYGFSEQMLARAKDIINTNPLLVFSADGLRNEMNIYKLVISQKGSESTSAIRSKLNATRNRDILSVRDHFKSFTQSPDAEEAKAAELLVQVYTSCQIKTNGMGQVQESGKLNIFFGALEAEDKKRAIEKLRMAPWIERLKKSEQAFLQTFAVSEGQGNATNLPKIPEIHKNMMSHVRIILENLNLIQRQTKDQRVLAILKEIDNMTIQLNAAARARRTRNQNESDESETESIPQM